MILYCDTSAVVKLYVVEPFSADIRRLIEEAEVVAVCRIAWAEAHAALSRRAREVPTDAPAISSAKRALGEDWPRYLIMEVTQPLVERAARYADTFALRGYDSVQLAAAHETALLAEAAVSFACFDERLNKAASVLGMTAPFVAGA
jgi:predicted nucleic acid-binding protein